MSKYIVKAAIRKLGKECAACTQHVEFELNAESSEDAVAQAKKASRFNDETHQFKLQLVKEV